MKKRMQVADHTEVSVDDERSYDHFLRVQAGPARLDLSHGAAEALHELLTAYFVGEAR